METFEPFFRIEGRIEYLILYNQYGIFSSTSLPVSVYLEPIRKVHTIMPQAYRGKKMMICVKNIQPGFSEQVRLHWQLKCLLGSGTVVESST